MQLETPKPPIRPNPSEPVGAGVHGSRWKVKLGAVSSHELVASPSSTLATLATILATTLIITSLKIAMNGLKEEGWPTPGAATRPTADGSGGRTLQYLSGGQADGQDLALPVNDGRGLGRGLRARHRRRPA